MRILFLFSIILIAGCAALVSNHFDQLYGEPDPTRFDTPLTSGSVDFHNQIKPILEARCAACHACYDAACQLKLDSYEGITRGLSQQKVYDGTRIFAAQPSRLFEDAHSIAEWRQKGFSPVLNERVNNAETNIIGSVMAQSLLLKEANPLPDTKLLGDSFTLGLGRDQQCQSIENYARMSKQFPLWGMPYGLPGLAKNEQDLILQWISEGAPVQPTTDSLTAEIVSEIEKWEVFFNQNPLKDQLMARYIYEHLFPANLYFSDIQGNPVFLKLVRSSTAPGQPLEQIGTRLPFLDPGVDRVYYRFIPMRESVVLKSHMPYALNTQKMDRWVALFLGSDYEVTALPSYERESASNPFITFEQLPPKSRFSFLLDEAQYTVMAYIKGPVCRGQAAVDVINDHFWVVFSDPEVDFGGAYSAEVEQALKMVELPAAAGSTSMLLNWLSYAGEEKKYLNVKADIVEQQTRDEVPRDLSLLWDGGDYNQNASLTVYRHNDNATVVKGLQGDQPQTTWLINYSLLERIHYLLVAGYDVYGNVGHQLNSRIYMEFLRIEAENNFLSLLPNEARSDVLAHWYRGDVSRLAETMQAHSKSHVNPDIPFQTDTPLDELYALLKTHMAPVSDGVFALKSARVSESSLALLEKLDGLRGTAISVLPENTILALKDSSSAEQSFYSLLRNTAFTNITHLFDDRERRLPDEDYLTVAPGFIGAYPNAYLSVSTEDLAEFVARIKALDGETDYTLLMDDYGIRRTNSSFWQFSDAVQGAARRDRIEGGILDYNRLENR